MEFAYNLGRLVAQQEKQAADLSKPENRRKVPMSDFAIKNKTPKGTTKKEDKAKYPIPDKAHARAALGFAAMHHGHGSEYQAVARKVHAKYPEMGK